MYFLTKVGFIFQITSVLSLLAVFNFLSPSVFCSKSNLRHAPLKLLLHIQIIQKVNHFQGQIIGLRRVKRLAHVAKIGFITDIIHAVFKLIDAVFPNNIHKTTWRKLPRIDHINIEKIDISVLICVKI